ncbi:SLAM family member 9-like [Phascolarctos cinereus]|uniref:V-set and immunoglobulin domain-containing protein 10-like n=1 Tax=Phascolarctos cinereus TaxID=38626 RepID=UPI000A282234|nr:V-set and immunoglobulin domain-containing protein 10-like [Phascolarctos cinereus]XP_020847706.1 V-set and immunoglobulin domain-containing protein 10-like [Phascolarctos cinereus]
MRRILQLFLLFLQSQKGTQKKGARNSCHTVDGIVKGDILLALNVSQGTEIQEIEWRFNSEKLQLLSLQPGSHSFLWYSPLDRYKKRLDAMDDGSLIIRNVTLKDSGLYEARVLLISGVFNVHSFALSIYEPIPDPQIHIQSQCLTPLWCNITLDCQVSGPGKSVTITWRSRNLLSGLNQAELSEESTNSRTVSLSLPVGPSNSSLTCLASNPVDQRNITIDLKDICALKDIYASDKAPQEPVNVYSCPLKWILLWKGLLLLGILLWTLGSRFTLDKGQTEEGPAKKRQVTEPQPRRLGKNMSLVNKQ